MKKINWYLTNLLFLKKTIVALICGFIMIGCKSQEATDFQKIDKSEHAVIEDLITNLKKGYLLDSAGIMNYLSHLVEKIDSINGNDEGQFEIWGHIPEYEVYIPYYSDTLKIIDSDIDDNEKTLIFNAIRIQESKGLTNRILIRFYNTQNNRIKEIFEYKPRTHNNVYK